MAAKITDSIKNIVVKGIYDQLRDSVNTDTYYAAIAFTVDSDYITYAGTDSEISEFYNDDNTTFDLSDQRFYAQNTVSMHRVLPGGISRVVRRINWIENTVYNSWDEGGDYYVLVQEFNSGIARLNVYKCLYSPGTPSTIPPAGGQVGTGIKETSDDYIWIYMYTIDNSQAIRFLTEDYMPVPERVVTQPASGQTSYQQYIQQDQAEAGTVYNAIVDDSEALKLWASNNEYENLSIPVRFRDSINSFNKNILTIGEGELTINDSEYTFTHSITGTGYSSFVEAYDSVDGSAIDGISVKSSPGLGHGSNAPEELNAYSLMMTVRNIPEGDILNVLYGQFRMLNLIRNPVDRITNSIAEKDLYFACNSFIADSPSLQVGDVIRNNSNTVTARVVAIHETTDNKFRVFYINHLEGTSSQAFKDSENVFRNGTPVATITAVNEREVEFGSGDIIISDWRAEASTRSGDQIESLNFIVTF